MWALARNIEVPNERLQPTGKGRGETAAASVKVRGRAPSRRLKRNVSGVCA